MMQKNKDWVKAFLEQNNLVSGRVLDVGSRDINGNIRDIFEGWHYTGLDMLEGKNVDVVCNAHTLPFESNSFDLVVCLDLLEHDDDPFLTAQEIVRVLKNGCYAIISASGITFAKHEHPFDYWRFTKEGLQVLFKELEVVEGREDNNEAYFIGQK